MESQLKVGDSTESQEQVILVHGTFAASDEDCGHAWWQVGSPAHEELQNRLPASISLAPEGNIFRWSGENDERARSKAAGELLEYLKPFESSGTPYHIIGHSHGGSVIWNALRTATSRRKHLRQLRSWSTVGTPFLHHRSRSPWNIVNIFYMIAAALLLIPALHTLSTLASIPYDLATNNLNNGIVIQSSDKAGLVTSVLRAPMLEVMKYCGMTFTETVDGIRVGSYDPSSGESISEFLFKTSEGWVILGAIVVFGYSTLLLSSWFIRPILESIRIRWEQRLEENAFAEYGDRWLGLWTPDDEAINGLRATLELSVSFLNRLVPRERIFLSDTVSLIYRPFFWVLAPIYNTALRPLLDSGIRQIVIRSAQGNNRPAAHVVAVTPGPLLGEHDVVIPPLPAALSSKILADADRHAGDLGPKLRQLLAQPSFTAGLNKFSQETAGRSLVHTSYFDHAEVLDLLAINIVWSRDETSSRVTAADDINLKLWFLDFKRKLGVTTATPSDRLIALGRETPNVMQDAA
ncbi:MAG: hypothetical protein COA78_34680 [Blastopirellula sp.]|nr:MAG: hypothetical protein COA78_34680 [Blastopirellula sp.]